MVQLPQSLSFSSKDKQQQDQQVINSLPSGMLTLFARQQESLQYASAHYPNTKVLPAPDLAFSLGPLMPGEPTYDVLFLVRKDKEAAASEQPLVKLKPGAHLPASDSLQGGTGGQAATGSAGTREDGAKAIAGALQQLDKLGITYTIREWEYANENYTKEVSQVSPCWC